MVYVEPQSPALNGEKSWNVFLHNLIFSSAEETNIYILDNVGVSK